MESTQKRIAVAMSGGVDSSVTAALLQRDGYAVEGVFMALAQPDLDQQVQRVGAVAARLGVPLTVLDFGAAFQDQVVDYFCTAYCSGQTPNPCMVCNPTIKFGRLLEAVLARGCQGMATGHYVRLHRDGGMHLLRGRDPAKDQSYFLSQLTQGQLRHVLFPLGGYTKQEVYGLAEKFGIAGVHGSESQDVCFLQGTTVARFLTRSRVSDAGPGPICTVDGVELGRHQGISRYTIGQRRGLGICDASPYYVVALRRKTNTVVVGKDADLWSKRLLVGQMRWLVARPPTLPVRLTVQIRYRHRAAPAMVTVAKEGVQVDFEQPQRAITPGQFAVLYQGDELLGGGMIQDLDDHGAGG